MYLLQHFFCSGRIGDDCLELILLTYVLFSGKDMHKMATAAIQKQPSAENNHPRW